MMKLTLKEKKQEAENIWSFIFSKPEGLTFQAGQFLQLFVPHENPDDRGIERYFTVAASPTEDFLMITTKIVQGSSTFKKALLSSLIGATFEAVEPDGSFVLPEKITTCILIAGGIGITPFLSMLKAMKNENGYKVDFYYCVKNRSEAVFLGAIENVLPEVRVIPFYSDSQGYITSEEIEKLSGGLRDKDIFFCAPPVMMRSLKKQLSAKGVSGDLMHSEEFEL